MCLLWENLCPSVYLLWQYGLWIFQVGSTKLERLLHKNQRTQRKLKNFQFWINGDLSKIGHHFSNENFIKKLVFFNEKKIEKDSDDF